MSVNGVSAPNFAKLVRFGHWLANRYGLWIQGQILEENRSQNEQNPPERSPIRIRGSPDLDKEQVEQQSIDPDHEPDEEPGNELDHEPEKELVEAQRADVAQLPKEKLHENPDLATKKEPTEDPDGESDRERVEDQELDVPQDQDQIPRDNREPVEGHELVVSQLQDQIPQESTQLARYPDGEPDWVDGGQGPDVTQWQDRMPQENAEPSEDPDGESGRKSVEGQGRDVPQDHVPKENPEPTGNFEGESLKDRRVWLVNRRQDSESDGELPNKELVITSTPLSQTRMPLDQRIALCRSIFFPESESSPDPVIPKERAQEIKVKVEESGGFRRSVQLKTVEESGYVSNDPATVPREKPKDSKEKRSMVSDDEDSDDESLDDGDRHWKRRKRRRDSDSSGSYRKTTTSTLYMDVEPLKRRDPAPAKEYRTKDPEENLHNDIDNPEWDEWKRPTNDRERMDLVRERFGNLVPGDPNKCLSFHGYRRRAAAVSNGMSGYDTGIGNPLMMEIRNGSIVVLDDLRTVTGSRKRKLPEEHEDAPPTSRIRNDTNTERRKEPISFDEYEREMIRILERFKKPIYQSYVGRKDARKAESEWKYCLRHFKGSLEEIFNFAEYYGTGNDRVPVMSMDELDRSCCAEKIFFDFVQRYGPNRPNLCKDCSSMENHQVIHQY